MIQRPSNQQETPAIIGDEELNAQALAAIERRIGLQEKVLAYSGFDWEQKVIAITDRRVIIADNNGSEVFVRGLRDLSSVSREGRTLVFRSSRRKHEFRMEDEGNVSEIEYLIKHQVSLLSGQESPLNLEAVEDNNMSMESPNIAERVKFWEEQDKINQELIPRVIRQNDLLTSHIADHENLPLVAGNAIREALAEAREEQRQQHEAEMAELRAEAEEQRRRHQIELEAARGERQQQAEALVEAKAAAEDQARRHGTELAAAKAEREEQSRQHSNEVTTLQTQLRQARNQMMMVAGGAVVIAIAAVVIGILV